MKLKNKWIFFIFALAVIAFAFTAQSGICAEAVKTTAQAAAGAAVQIPSKQTGIQDTAIKFILAMGGVMLSSFLIYAGLTIYNKFFADKSLFHNKEDDDILNTPKTAEDAVTFFIKRNKLC